MLRLRSAAFEDGGQIPHRSASPRVEGGGNLSVPLEWDGAPEGTASLALLMLDRHPAANGFVHWMVADIPGDVPGLPEGVSHTAAMPHGSVELGNTGGGPGYIGPSPPAGSGPHRYEVSVYALSVARLGVDDGSSVDDFTDALEGNVLDVATISGTFER